MLGGWLFWTLTEYWLHRLVFHFEPESGPGARLHWIIHGVHHDHPNDPLRLVMPPSVSVPLALIFYGLFVLVMGSSAPAEVFASGFLTGYLIYDMTHYHVHHHKPKGKLGKLLRELHMRHHFQDDTRLRGQRTVLGLRVRHPAAARQAVHGRPAPFEAGRDLAET